MTISNKITLFRICLTPVFVIIFYIAVKTGDFRWYIPCLAISVIQELTDLLDGLLARRRGEITDIGKIMDPFADLLSHFSAFLCLLFGGFIPLWAVIIIFWRETYVYTMRILLAKNNIVLAARISGKIKAVIQGGAIYCILFMIIIHGYFQIIPLLQISLILISITVAATIWSWIDYFKATYKYLKK